MDRRSLLKAFMGTAVAPAIIHHAPQAQAREMRQGEGIVLPHQAEEAYPYDRMLQKMADRAAYLVDLHLKQSVLAFDVVHRAEYCLPRDTVNIDHPFGNHPSDLKHHIYAPFQVYDVNVVMSDPALLDSYLEPLCVNLAHEILRRAGNHNRTLVYGKLQRPLPGTGALSAYAVKGLANIRVIMSYCPASLLQMFTVDTLFGVAGEMSPDALKEARRLELAKALKPLVARNLAPGAEIA